MQGAFLALACWVALRPLACSGSERVVEVGSHNRQPSAPAVSLSCSNRAHGNLCNLLRVSLLHEELSSSPDWLAAERWLSASSQLGPSSIASCLYSRRLSSASLAQKSLSGLLRLGDDSPCRLPPAATPQGLYEVKEAAGASSQDVAGPNVVGSSGMSLSHLLGLLRITDGSQRPPSNQLRICCEVKGPTTKKPSLPLLLPKTYRCCAKSQLR